MIDFYHDFERSSNRKGIEIVPHLVFKYISILVFRKPLRHLYGNCNLSRTFRLDGSKFDLFFDIELVLITRENEKCISRPLIVSIVLDN